MRAWTVCIAFAVAAVAAPAYGQSCSGGFPYNNTNGLSNGSVAAGDLMWSNFGYISTCYAPLASPSFTGNVGIGTSLGVGLTASGAAGDVAASGSGAEYKFYDRNGDGKYGVLYRNGDVNSLFDSVAGNVLSYTASGYVGIGTTAPQATLHLATPNAQIIAQGPTGSYTWWSDATPTSAAQMIMNQTVAGGIEFRFLTSGSWGSDAMAITPSGNVGIGTTTPANTLDVSGGINLEAATAGLSITNATGSVVGGALRISNSNASSAIGFNTYGGSNTNDLQFSAYTTAAGWKEAMTIQNATGYVGIGTSTPNATLDVEAGNAAFVGSIKQSWNNVTNYVQYPNNYTSTPSYYMGWATNASNRILYIDNEDADGTATDPNGGIVLRTGGTPTARMIVDYYGKVGIGTTSPNYLLQVGSTSASGIVAEWQNSGGYCTLTPPTSTLTCSSDARLKKDIADAGAALPSLTDIRVRDFTLRATGQRMTGVIAQELLKTHPDMVHQGPDGFYLVDQPNSWKLVKAIQELKAQNDRQQADNESLRRDADRIERDNTALRRELVSVEGRMAAIELKAASHSRTRSARSRHVLHSARLSNPSSRLARAN